MQKQGLFISVIFLVAISCTNKCEIKSSFYLQPMFCEDSMLVIINDTDEIDTTSPSKAKIYKIGLPRKVKQVVSDFIGYSKTKQNGLIDNADFDGGAIYDGGTFLVYYRDIGNKEHYFYYSITNLSSSTQQLHDELINYYYKELSFYGTKRSIRINTDSIVIALEKKPGMENITLPPPRVEPPPIRE